MTIETAIQKSIEGGWQKDIALDNRDKLQMELNEASNGYLLDPLFWQSLQKGAGWEGTNPYGTWKELWHRLIDWLIAGRSIEQFFAGLE